MVRTNVIASVEEIRLRTKLAAVERNEVTSFQQCSHSADTWATPIDADENRQRTIPGGAHGLSNTY